MFARWYSLALLLTLLALSGPALGQEQELLNGQAGRYPLRAYLKEPAAVGPAKLVVELGKPKELAKLPESKHTPAVDEPPPPPPRELAVSVVMEMPDMISTRPTSVKLTSTAPNRFEGDVLITMKGDWRVQFVVQTPEGEFRPLAKFKVGAGSSAAPAGEDGLELCDPSSDAIPLKIRSFPDPARVGQNRIRIELPQDVTVPVMVGVSMPGLALGIPPREAVRQDDGSYEAIVNLPMAGYWQLRVDLNGNALPPFALTVEEPRTAGPNRLMLPIAVLVLIPVILFVALRKRSALRPVLMGSALFLAILVAGTLIERLWPSQHAGSMEMDMMAPDMGMGRLSAPLPVLESKLEKTAFVTTRSYPATVVAAKESVVVSNVSGVLTQLAPVGTYLATGATAARVGSQTVLATSSGVVLQHFLNNGSSVNPGTAVLSLSDPKSLAVRARAPLADRDMLQAGLPVDVFGRNDGQRAPGKLSLVSGVSEGQSFTIEATLDNTRPLPPVHAELEARPSTPRVDLGVFVLGQSVNLKVALEGRRSTITVPRDAVRQTPDGEARVFLVTPVAGQKVAREQKVTLGEASQNQIEIVSGLSEGQIIVARLEPSLRNGDVITKATLGGGVYRSLVVPGDGSH